MKNDKILIFGDSYSTFDGYIPNGYAVYYPRHPEDGVDEVSKTWWHMLAAQTQSEIVLNNSWSGSTICNTGWDGDCSQTSSFIHRLELLIDEGFFEKNRIDRVLVFGATNDSWTENECKTPKFSDWTNDDLRFVLPGISYFADKLLGAVSKEKIHFIINTELRDEVADGIAEICKHYEIGYTVLSDIEKFNGHPTYNGMIAIKNQILKNI